MRNIRPINAYTISYAPNREDIILDSLLGDKNNGVYVVENKPLARGLYKDCQIGRAITPEYYALVADLLVYVYKLKNKLPEV